MDQIIINYLIGEISLEEQHKLKKWLDEDNAHPVILEQMEKYWTQGDLNFPEKKKLIYSKLMSEIRTSNKPKTKIKKLRVRSFIKYAAVVLIASLISVFSYSALETEQLQQVSLIKYVEKVSLPGQKIITVLPDGTRVKLNADSKIMVPETFAEDKREVTLVGEAYFDVVANPQKPFIIHFGNNQVKVLGTSFNIKAYGEENSYVAVRTGKVLVRQGDEEIELVPNEMTQMGQAHLRVSQFDDEMAFGWIDNKLSFNKASIVEVMESISKWYGVRFEIRKEIDGDKLYTASHNNPTLKEVMEILTYTYDIDYEIKNNTVIIE